MKIFPSVWQNLMAAGLLALVLAGCGGKLRALRAMQRREFNRDDIQGFKQTLCAGEGNDGYLKFFDNERTKTDAQFKEFAEAIIAEEN